MVARRILRNALILLVSITSIASSQEAPQTASPESLEQIDAPKRVIQVSDALALDAESEATLARFKEQPKLDDEAVNTLRQLAENRSAGLIPDSRFEFDSFAAEVYRNARDLAGEKLLPIIGARNVTSISREGLATYEDSQVGRISSAAIAIAANQRQDVMHQIDQLIEIGWTYPARYLLQCLEPSHRLPINSGDPAVIKKSIQQNENASVAWHPDVLLRLVYCSYLERNQARFEAESELVNLLVGDKATIEATTNRSVKDTLQDWRDGFTLQESAQPKSVLPSCRSTTGWLMNIDSPIKHIWRQKVNLPGYPSPSLRLNVTANDDRIFARSSSQVYGRDLAQSYVWPRGKIDGILYSPTTSNLALNVVSETLLGNMVGDGHYLFLLVDSSQRSSAASSTLQSADLIGLDLSREASMVGASPLQYENIAKESDAATFVGTPLLTGDTLYVLVAKSGSGRQAYQVVCLEVPSLSVKWISPTFGSDSIGSSSDSAFSTAMLAHQGKLFVAPGNGFIAALHMDDGTLNFQVNYETPRNSQFDPRSKINRRTTLMLSNEVVVCCVSDARSVFAIDWSDGHVRWALPSGTADRLGQAVGIYNSFVICIGDRIGWIHSATGELHQVLELPLKARCPGGQAYLMSNKLIWSSGETVYAQALEDNISTAYALSKNLN